MTVAIAAITIITSLFVPGLFLTSALVHDPAKSLATAPAVSCFLLLIIGITLRFLNVNATPISMLAIPSVMMAFFFALFSARNTHRRTACSVAPRFQIKMLCFYILIGSFLVIFVYFKHLHGLDAFQPDNDNATHLGLIKNMVSTRNMSVLSTGVYLNATTYPDTTNVGSFYPAVFHTIAALAVMTSGVQAQVAENLTSAVVIAAVYTSGCYALFRSLGPDDKGVQISGGITCLLIVGFPWIFIVWGPLYPNLLSLSLIPAALSLEIEICDRLTKQRISASQIAVYAMSLVAIAGSHPNGIFTLGVLSIPLLIRTAYVFPKVESNRFEIKPLLFASLTFTVIAVLWTVCFKLPQLQSVVNYKWAADQTFPQAIQSLLFFGYTRETNQPLLLILLCVGIISQLKARNRGWTIVSYLITSIMYIVAVCIDGPVKQFLCGFWYCDHTRIAACTSLSAMVLVSLGLSEILRFVSAIASKYRLSNMSGLKALLLALVLLDIVFPVLPGQFLDKKSPFVDYKQLLDYKFSNDSPKVYSREEQEFVEKAKEIVPSDVTILNIPFDGSCFAYDIQDLNVYYRDPHICGTKVDTESYHSWLFRKSLSNYLDDSEVMEALASDNIGYVLLLDNGNSDNELERFFSGYSETDWNGLASVNEGTPGFRLVAAEDDMRLYRITFCK